MATNKQQSNKKGKIAKSAPKKNKWALPAIVSAAVVMAIVIFAVTRGTGDNGGGSVTDGVQTISSGESLLIPVSEISETATFYPVTVDGVSMEVVAVTAPDGTIRTAFNTCQVCNGSPKAYFEQSGNTLQCQNCGNRFPMDRVEVEAGGCNPVPILTEDKTVTDESITVPYVTLQANAYRFPSNWKK